MGVLDAFYSTWSQARTSFGEGAPKTGEFDSSARLRQMESTIQSAAPDDRWQGPASQAYAAKNTEHAAVYGKLADLDQRMAAEVNKSATVVTTGRQKLDQVHAWVTDAAASAPKDQSGERMKLAIANKGIGQVNDIVQTSNAEMTAIGERVRGLGREYDEIRGPEDGEDSAEIQANRGQADEANETALDFNDIKWLEPGQPGPRGYMEVVPGSGTWIPDPSSPDYVPVTHNPPHLVDLDDIVYTEPGALGPRGYVELVPDSGVWIDRPGFNGVGAAPPDYSEPVTKPLNLNEINRQPPGELGPYGHRELVPGSGLWIWSGLVNGQG